MTPYAQLFRHDPENGLIGDCYRTCIGCLFDLPPDQVPHFNDPPERCHDACRARVNEWLIPRGLRTATIAFSAEVSTLDIVLDFMRALNPNVEYILAGMGRAGVNHCVVARGGDIVHDPSGSGIVGPCDDGNYWLEFLVKR